MQSGVETGSFQGGLDFFDEPLAPGVLLLTVVNGEERLFGQRCHQGPEVGLFRQHLAFLHTGVEEWLHDFGPIPLRFGLGDPAQAVATCCGAIAR